MSPEKQAEILAKHAEIRRLICSQISELGAINEHIGSAEETFRLKQSSDVDTMARAECYGDIHVASAQVGILAHELTMHADELIGLNSRVLTPEPSRPAPRCTVCVRGNSGSGFVARAGSGKSAKTASCTMCAEVAAYNAACKFLGIVPRDKYPYKPGVVENLSDDLGKGIYSVSPTVDGGAS